MNIISTKKPTESASDDQQRLWTYIGSDPIARWTISRDPDDLPRDLARVAQYVRPFRPRRDVNVLAPVPVRPQSGSPLASMGLDDSPEAEELIRNEQARAYLNSDPSGARLLLPDADLRPDAVADALPSVPAIDDADPDRPALRLNRTAQQALGLGATDTLWFDEPLADTVLSPVQSILDEVGATNRYAGAAVEIAGAGFDLYKIDAKSDRTHQLATATAVGSVGLGGVSTVLKFLDVSPKWQNYFGVASVVARVGSQMLTILLEPDRSVQRDAANSIVDWTVGTASPPSVQTELGSARVGPAFGAGA